MLSIQAFKLQFFDKVVVDAADRSAVTALSRFGGLLRRDIRQSIRKPPKKNPQPRPGKPPFNRTGKLKGSILYAYDKSSRTVIVGPYLFSGKSYSSPAALEAGERVTRRGKALSFRKFPFVGPAFERQKSKAAEMFRGQLSRG